MNTKQVSAEDILATITELNLTSEFEPIEVEAGFIVGIYPYGNSGKGHFIGIDDSFENTVYFYGNLLDANKYANMNIQYAMSLAKVLNQYIDMKKWGFDNESYI